MSSNGADNGHGGSVTVHRDRVLVSLKSEQCHKPRSLINAHFSISTYFLTVLTYKCLHLTTRVYGSKKWRLAALAQVAEWGRAVVMDLNPLIFSPHSIKFYMG